jgi:trehalose 6-phosphate phosphatase
MTLAAKTPPPPLDRGEALFLDVDGTLLEIAPRPDLVAVPPELPPLLGRLARRQGGALALVSGRRIADVDRLLRPWRGAVAGLHGGERRRADGSYVKGDGKPLDLAAKIALDRLRPLLAEAPRRWPGMRLEDKGKTLALHYRAAPEREAEARAFAAALLAGASEALRLIDGKRVFEFQPRHYGKDRAIAAFLDEAPFCGRRPIFLGDDTTDEDGFAEVNRRGGRSIRVGLPRPTCATAALPSVAAALAWLRSGLTG